VANEVESTYQLPLEPSPLELPHLPGEVVESAIVPPPSNSVQHVEVDETEPVSPLSNGLRYTESEFAATAEPTLEPTPESTLPVAGAHGGLRSVTDWFRRVIDRARQ